MEYGAANLESLGSLGGLRSDSWAPSIGMDHHLDQNWTLGGALSYLKSHQTFKGNQGGFGLDGAALSGYLSYVNDHLWSDLLYSWGSYDLDMARHPGAGYPMARGEANSTSNSVQCNMGWNFTAQQGAMVTGPFAGLDWIGGQQASFDERGGGFAALRYQAQSYDSLVTRLGWQISKRIEMTSVTVTPQLRLGWEHESMDDNGGTGVQLLQSPYYLARSTRLGNDRSSFSSTRLARQNKTFQASAETQWPGQDYLAVGGGVHCTLRHGLSAVLNYQGQVLRSDFMQHIFAVRLNWTF